MIQQKPKKCKGINKANGFDGCGKETLKRRFGLCPSCLWDWMLKDERGKLWREKQFIPQVEKKQRKVDREKKREQKIDLMSTDRYRSTYVQPLINKIVRTIDYGQPCIATGNFGKMNGGHYRSVGSNRTLALNLHNIHIQSYESNVFRGGDDKNFQDGLKDVYGSDYFDFVHALRKHRPIKLLKGDLKEIKFRCENILKNLEDVVRTPEQRIILRNELNAEIGIYDSEFSFYELKEENV